MLPSKVQTIESRQIAEMMGKNHSNLLKDISRYQQYLSQVKINFADFFIESVYLDAQDKERKCYQITKKGCEFLAHKMTGEKGAVFTAKYINRFHEMQEKEEPSSLAEAPEELRRLIQTLIFQQMDLKQQMSRIAPSKTAADLLDMGQLITMQQDSIREPYKIDTFPKELKEAVELLLRQEDRNFSYIARLCTARGYAISSTAIGRYYRNRIKEERS